MAFGDLCQLADAKLWLQTGQNPFPVTDDALLTRLITATSDAIKRSINRTIALQDYGEWVDGRGLTVDGPDIKYMFSVYPVTAVAYVQVNGVMVPAIPDPPLTAVTVGVAVVNAFSTLTQAGYTFTPTELFIRGYPVPRYGRSVYIQYTAGYQWPGQIPTDLTQACIDIVCLEYRARSRIGEVSKHLGDGSTVNYMVKIPDMIERKLTPWINNVPTNPNLFSIVAPDQTPAATIVSVAA